MKHGHSIIMALAALVLAACTSTVGTFWEDDADGDTQTSRNCSESADCPPGMICADDVCRVWCTADDGCAEGLVCDTDDNICRDPNAPEDGDVDGDEPKPDGDSPDGDTPDGDVPDGDTPDGDTPDGDTPDGDTPDGDAPDGDTPDGDTPDGDTPDGDEPDGDLPDGDTPCGECPPRQHCDETLGECVYDAEHCAETGCEAPTICDEATGICEMDADDCRVSGCDEGYSCNETTGECEQSYPDFPSYCQSCTSSSDCADGVNCIFDRDIQGFTCAPPCRDRSCPEGGECSLIGILSYGCLPKEYACGIPHEIGGPCESDDDCIAGTYCLTEVGGVSWTGGYCTSDCDADSVGDSCGDDANSRCTGYRTDYGDFYLCLNTCGLTMPCRENYNCVDTSNRVNVCAPRTAP